MKSIAFLSSNLVCVLCVREGGRKGGGGEGDSMHTRMQARAGTLASTRESQRTPCYRLPVVPC